MSYRVYVQKVTYRLGLMPFQACRGSMPCTAAVTSVHDSGSWVPGEPPLAPASDAAAGASPSSISSSSFLGSASDARGRACSTGRHMAKMTSASRRYSECIFSIDGMSFMYCCASGMADCRNSTYWQKVCWQRSYSSPMPLSGMKEVWVMIRLRCCAMSTASGRSSWFSTVPLCRASSRRRVPRCSALRLRAVLERVMVSCRSDSPPASASTCPSFRSSTVIIPVTCVMISFSTSMS
mmetsp:Transcript_24473/g.61491  ORF Transcript_24473/g.61491 Transcript_24473/m.61491 type:complete len:237 (-) Transcript_24473:2027-2737(-)